MGQLEDMQVFVRVVEAGGVGLAAEQLGIAKSAVSRKLSDLETRLGVTLIHRTTRTSSITEVGSMYYERALRVIDDVDELNTITSDPDVSLKGTLRLAAPLSFGLSHLAPVLDTFAKNHPDLTLNIDFSDKQIDLVEGGYDLAFRIGELADSSLKARKIFPVKIIICASPAYLEKYGRPMTVEDLQQHQLLRYTLVEGSSFKCINAEGRETVVSMRSKIQANNGDFLNQMAVAGHGILVSPTFIAWQALATGDLVPILEDCHLPQTYAYAVYPKTRYLSHRARVLIDCLQEQFGDNPYWDQCLKM